jgi:hypothetical protein
MIPQWFLYLAGFSLILLGGLQIQQRPRQPGDGVYKRFVNLGTFWSVLCIAVGVALLAMALGYLAGPGGGPAPEPKLPRYH